MGRKFGPLLTTYCSLLTAHSLPLSIFLGLEAKVNDDP